MQENFLADLRALNPDLCITSAYGNFLPSKFLAIPPCGKRSPLFDALLVHILSVVGGYKSLLV